MHSGLKCFVFALITAFLAVYTADGRDIRNKHARFRISLPGALELVDDTSKSIEGLLYYDTTAKVILLVSERKSEFHSVREYIDCSKAQLEDQLKNFYSDPALTLLNCSKSEFYPKKTVALSFTVSVFPAGFNTCLVYFIHHHHRDIQFSFTYKKELSKESLAYIRSIMQTLRLK